MKTRAAVDIVHERKVEQSRRNGGLDHRGCRSVGLRCRIAIGMRCRLFRFLLECGAPEDARDGCANLGLRRREEDLENLLDGSLIVPLDGADKSVFEVFECLGAVGSFNVHRPDCAGAGPVRLDTGAISKGFWCAPLAFFSDEVLER